MTALPVPPEPLPLPLTVAEYVALGEDPDGVRYELQEGALVMAASPIPEHQRCTLRLGARLEAALPADLDVFPDVDIDLELTAPGRPGTVRRPDLAVVTRSGFTRRQREGGVLRASEVVLAVEIVSPGSERTDHTIKHLEYADAGIPHYWVVDLGESGDRVTLTAHHLAGEFGYAAAGSVTGVFAATEPFSVRIDLDTLV
jgi:Uma2 family endonuclease